MYNQLWTCTHVMAAPHFVHDMRTMLVFGQHPVKQRGDDFGVCTKGSINFIHDIEGGGLVVVQGKDKGEGAEGLLPARQVANVLPALLGRPHTEDNALHQ